MWPVYGIDPGNSVLDPESLFPRRAPVTLEIGFGNGESLATLAAGAPRENFIGVEIHRPGVGRLLRRIDELGLTNLRLLCTDAALLLRQNLRPASLRAVLLYFPDPWPKKRHHKRRLVQPEFARLVRRVLREGGEFRMATDWEDYARHMMAVMERAEGFENWAGRGRYAPRGVGRPETKFERRGERLGHLTRDLVYVAVRS